MFFFWILFFGLAAWVISLAGQVSALKARLEELESKNRAPSPGKEPAEKSRSIDDFRPPQDFRPAAMDTKPVIPPAPVIPPPPVVETKPPSTPESPRTESFVPPSWDVPPEMTTGAAPQAWKKWGDKVVENWTGIVGAAILVLGVTFFGVLGSLYLGPEGRFAILMTIAAILFGGKVWLARKTGWGDFASWLQAASGAILLVACAGAGGIEGLRFIDQPLAALGLLLAGIGVNLFFGYVVASQAVASLHVVLSLLSLAVAPPTTTILMMGALVTGVGVLYSYRSRWDINLIVSLAAFSAFHYYWLHRSPAELADIRWFGIGANLFVGALAAIVHYRKNYENQAYDVLAAAAHLLNWGCLAIGLFRYSQGSPITSLLLFLAAILTTGLARIAGRKKIRWLFLMDTLLGQALFYVAIVSLSRFHIPSYDLAALAFLQSLVFALLLNIMKESTLLRVAYPLSWTSLLVLGATILCHQAEAPYALAYRLSVLGVFMTATIWVGSRLDVIRDTFQFVLKGESPERPFSLLAFATPFVFGYAYLLADDKIAAVLVLSTILFGLGLLRARAESLGLFAGLLVVITLLHFEVWHRIAPWQEIVTSESFNPLTLASLWSIAPLFALDLLFLYRGLSRSALWNVDFSRLFVYLGAAHTLIVAYRGTQPRSDFAPGLAYLILAVGFLEIARLLRSRFPVDSDRKLLPEYFLHASFAALALFLVRHLLVHIQSEATLGGFSLRLSIELFALAVLAYFIFFPVQAAESFGSKLNRYFTPLFLEVAVAFSTFVLAYELPAEWHPVVWSAMALVLAAAVRWKQISRLGLYSWLYFIASAVQLAAVSSRPTSALDDWFTSSAILGVLSIVLQAIYVLVAVKQNLFEKVVELPEGLGFLRWIEQRLRARSRMFLFYPLAISVAVFFYWRFDHALLTLLWVLEIFGLFVLGIVVREKHFVRFSLTALVLCTGRLLLYDLSETQILLRALVFVAIGGIMLAINAIYKRYKDRFTS